MNKTETPLFTFSDGLTFPSGTAFVVEFQGKQYVICPRHLVRSREIAKVEMKSGPDLLVSTGPILNKEVQGLDLMVFEVQVNNGMTAFKLAEGVGDFNAPITVLPSNISGTALNRDEELMIARLDESIPEGSSGSAVLNEAGEVVSMYIGARNDNRITIHGVAAPLIIKTLQSL